MKWTCDQIPLNSIEKACEQIVDENVPEILKILNSAMDPVTVCTKLFFCHNTMLSQAFSRRNLLPFTCTQCNHIGSIIEKNFQALDRDEFLEKALAVCGEMSSFSDSCSSLLLTNVDDVYTFIGEKLRRATLCRTAGACSRKQAKGVALSDAFPTADPGIPCQLCQQAVLHLREVFIANTTEIEFKNILIGFCHETGSFSNECINITYEYSNVIYKFLVEQLNADKACILLNICPRNDSDHVMKMPTMPLVSSDLHPLPVQDSSLAIYKNGTWCSTCEYLVRVVKDALGKQSTEDEIVNKMKKMCRELPQNIEDECVSIVDLYGDAIITLIDQDITPEYVCPKLKVCPPALLFNALEPAEKPTCPFCLLALQDIRDIVASNMTKQNIASVLQKLCSHLSDNMVGQCTEFVKTYSDEVIEMVLADFTPQEACIFIKLCTDNTTQYRHARIGMDLGFENGEKKKLDDNKAIISNPQCELCKEVVKVVEARVINKQSKVKFVVSSQGAQKN